MKSGSLSLLDPSGPAQELFNPLNAQLNPISHLLTLLGAHPILHVGRIRVNLYLLLLLLGLYFVSVMKVVYE
jgi:hypothetical protein